VAAIIFIVLALLFWPKPQAPKTEPLVVADAVVPVAVVSVPASAVSNTSVEELPPPASKLSFELGAVPQAVPLPESKVAEPVKPESKPAPIVAQTPKPVTLERKPPETKPRVAPVMSSGESSLKQVSRVQQADAEYRKALALQQQGHAVEALAGYETALKLNAQQDAARLAMAVLLMESKRSADAERVLQEGVLLKPAHTGFSMVLARVQIERGENEQALATLQKNLPLAGDKADYQAFYAALLQREGKHKEAVEHFLVAVQLAPDSGIWLMGYGISLQALERIDDAKKAFQQALDTRTLSPELTAFVQQKLKSF
jgi:MSHA biogenesis protein MshN